jgi:large subunit ribosomal protein L9
MKVMLMKDVYKLGRAGDVKRVADGYGRNYLIPQGLAVLATPGALKQTDRITAQATVQREALNEELGAVAEQLSGVVLTFTARASETGKLYGSVTTQMIADSISEKIGVEINRRQVDSQPLRALGEHKVEVRLTVDLVPEVTVIVYSEGEEQEVLETALDIGSDAEVEGEEVSEEDQLEASSEELIQEEAEVEEEEAPEKDQPEASSEELTQETEQEEEQETAADLDAEAEVEEVLEEDQPETSSEELTQETEQEEEQETAPDLDAEAEVEEVLEEDQPEASSEELTQETEQEDEQETAADLDAEAEVEDEEVPEEDQSETSSEELTQETEQEDEEETAVE